MIENIILDYCLKRYMFLKGMRIFVFGAGNGGTITVKTLKKLGLTVDNVIDNDPQKWNTKIEDVVIASPNSIFHSPDLDNFFILIALTNAKEVAEQLEKNGIESKRFDMILQRNSNIYLDDLHDLSHELFMREYHDINLEMQRIALRETAQFVYDNMFNVKQFNTRFDLIEFVLKESLIEGAYLEFGVFQGESINFISSIRKKESIYGFDSFEGLPEFWIPGNEKGKFSVSELPAVNKNVTLFKGWFDETIPIYKKQHLQNCSFIHIDCDLYSSTKIIFNELKDRIVRGTVIVFDEFFNYPNWKQGEYKAFAEFISESGHQFEYIGFVPRSMQVAVKIL